MTGRHRRAVRAIIFSRRKGGDHGRLPIQVGRVNRRVVTGTTWCVAARPGYSVVRPSGFISSALMKTTRDVHAQLPRVVVHFPAQRAIERGQTVHPVYMLRRVHVRGVAGLAEVREANMAVIAIPRLFEGGPCCGGRSRGARSQSVEYRLVGLRHLPGIGYCRRAAHGGSTGG